MSTRKGRKRQQNIVVEVEIEDENEDTAFLEKCKAPVKWGSMPIGYEIRDIKESEFETVIEFIRETYIRENLLCVNTNMLEDDLSIQDFLFYHLNILRDRCSICIVHTETERIAGIILLRVLHKKDFGKVFSRLRLTDGEAFKKIRKAYNYLNRKTDLYTAFECESYLRIYLLAIHSDFRKKNLGLFLLRAAVDVTRALNLPVLMGIFSKANLQKKARKIGLETIFEIYYVDWVENGEIIFSDPGPGNYTLALMAGKVTPRRSSRATSSRFSKKLSGKRKGSKILKKISIAIQKSEKSLLKTGSKEDEKENEKENGKENGKEKEKSLLKRVSKEDEKDKEKSLLKRVSKEDEK